MSTLLRKISSTQSYLDVDVEGLDFNSQLRGQDIKAKSSFVEGILIVISYIFCILFFPFSLFTVFMVVRQFERAVILRNGRLSRLRSYGPGLVCYLPCVDSVKFIDLRVISHTVRPQEALTKDSLAVSCDAVVCYRIDDPVAAVINITDYKTSTKLIAAATLRNVIGTRKLNEILMNRRAVSKEINQHLKTLTSKWGVSVLRVEIKDINLPLHMQKTMAAEAESSRLASAKIKVAKAELESTRSLVAATEILLDPPEGMALRYLQALQHIAGDKTHSIILPFSMSTIQKIFMK